MSDKSQDTESISRRNFIQNAGRAAAGIGLASSSLELIPKVAPAAPRRVMKNDKIVIGIIGCGGISNFNMHNLMGKPEVEFAAICDVDESHMGSYSNDIEKKYNRKPETYTDYRKLLERKDIDAVIIGTPDHWHALNLIHAVEAGKDAYCEKPISHDITEANAMAAAVKKYNKIVQVGTWQRSTQEFVNAVEFIRSGKLGKIIAVRAWKTDEARMGHHKPGAAVPNGFDYNAWIGPAEMTPYIKEYTHNHWRWFRNTGNGMTGDWGVHMMDIGLLAMSPTTDLVMPTEVSAYGGNLAWPDDDRTTPDTHVAIMRFKNPDFVFQWETGRDHADRPDNGTEFVSENGTTLTVWRGGWKVRDAGGKELPKEDAPSVSDHWQNWVDCLKSRQQTRSNLASMAQTTIVCHLANAAYYGGGTVYWDKHKMDLVGKAGRNTISYSRPYRKPYTLPVHKA